MVSLLAKSKCCGALFVWLDREQFARLRDNESFQRQQPRHENLVAFYRASPNLAKSGSLEERGKGKKHVTLAIPNSKSESPLAPRGRIHNWSAPTFENRSTASESNSHSDDSNDDTRAKSYERFRSDSEARSEEGGDGTQDACTSSDQVDPKKAKRYVFQPLMEFIYITFFLRFRKLQVASFCERSPHHFGWPHIYGYERICYFVSFR